MNEGDRCCALVGVEIAVDEPRVVVDQGVDEFVSDQDPLLGATAGQCPRSRTKCMTWLSSTMKRTDFVERNAVSPIRPASR
jgi:hypothetical protein